MLNIVFFSILLALIVGSVIKYTMFYQMNVEHWNNGNCRCGGKFNLLSSSRFRKDYQCTICKMVIVK